MDTEQPDIKEIFYTATEKKSKAERDAYLDEACGGDKKLRADVEALLKAHDAAGSFLELPPAGINSTLDAGPLTEGPGTRIGRYKLLQLIGEGGFGVVYMAEQEEPIRRKVALKIIKLGMDTKQVIARFEAERQALAMMDHPNIARVFDAGATDTGRPYFVMELVKGIPITEYCDKNNLDTRQRLALFIDVCKAVQHAHQKGIIHRDIKPSNVMITLHDGKPVPKIIDFGIAKATQHRLTEKTLFTEYRQFIGTPEYMSPEQAEMSGLDVDTRSDIYSLGVLLYELLTGTTPFEADKLRSAAYDEIRRIIREDEPPRPSTRLSTLGEALTDIAKHRDAQPGELRRIVRGDLDWVVMKAMEKDRTRRYETANGFARDIERHLRDEPVSAGPPSVRYRLHKFVRRHRTGVAAGLLVAAAIVAGLVVSTTMYFRAERQASISQAVNEFLNKDLLASFDPDRAKGHEVTVMEVLDAAVKKLEGKFKDAPSIEASIRDTLGTTYMNLGKYKAAEPHLERALELRRGQFGREHPDTLMSMAHLGWLYSMQGRYKEAEPLFAKALEGRRRVLGKEHPDTLKSMAQLGWLYSMQSRYKEAEPLLVKALEIQRRVLGEEHPDTLWSMHNLGWPYSVQGRYNEAEPLLVKALEIGRRVLGEEYSETLWTMCQLGELYNNQGRYNEAEPLFVKALEISRRVLGEEHSATLHFMNSLGELYNNQGRHNEAEPLFVKTLEGRRRVLGEEHPDTLNSMNSLGWLYFNQGRYSETEPLFVKALESRRRVRGEEHIDTMWSMNSLGWLYFNQGRYNEAEPLFVKALEICRRVRGEEHPDTLVVMSSLGELYSRQGRYNEAEPLLVKALESRRRVLGEEHIDTMWSMSNLGWLYNNQRRYKEAEPLFVKALEICRRVRGEEHPDTLNFMNSLGWLYVNQGRYKEAEPLFVKVLEIRRRVLGKEHPDTQNSIENLTMLVEHLGSLGMERYKAGAYEEAAATLKRVDEYRRTVLNNEPHPCEIAYIAMALHRLGRSQEAQASLEQLRQMFEDDQYVSEEYYLYEAEQLFAGENSKVYLAWERIKAGKLDEASKLIKELRSLEDPNIAGRTQSITKVLTRALYRLVKAGKLDEASQLIKELRSLEDPNIAGRIEGAIKYLGRAYYNRGKNAHYRGGGYAETIGDYEAAVRVDTSYSLAFSDLAYLQAACPVAEFRNVSKAVENATKACELTNWKDYRYLATLAAVYAEVGNFASAVKWQKEAIGLLPQDKHARWQVNYKSRLQLYESGKPYHMGNLWSFSTGEMVGWWKFDEAKDGNIIDSSGNNLHGKLIGDAKIISDPERGNVLCLDGNGDYVDCGNAPAFNFIGFVTVAAWIKANAFDKDWQALLTKGYGGIEFARSGLARVVNVKGTMDVNDGKWHHVAVVYDGTKLYLYMDGKLDNEMLWPTDTTTNEFHVLIGENAEETGHYWNGLIDDVRIYSYALSGAEVKALYEDGKPPLKKVSNK